MSGTFLTDLGDSPPKFESVSSLVRLVRIVTVLAWLAGLISTWHEDENVYVYLKFVLTIKLK